MRLDPRLGPLAGRRVIELADEAGLYCGKLLGDLGADVIKVERPGGDPSRLRPPFQGGRADPEASLSFLYLNTNKRGIVLDLENELDRGRFRRLVDSAQVLIDTRAPGELARLGLGFETLRSRHESLIQVSITGFGSTGPRSGWRSSDLIATAMGGAAHVIGEDTDPPVRLAASQAHVSASTIAAAGVLMALRHADRSGRGQRLDVSVQEAVASVAHVCGAAKFLDDGLVPKRRGSSLFASVPSGAYRCEDGLAYLIVNRPLHWQALARWISEVTANRDVLDPMFEGPSANRISHRELLDLWIGELTERFTVADFYLEGQRRHLAVTPVHTALDVARDPHLEARRYFVDVERVGGTIMRMPGAPYRPSATPWAIRRPAPRIGEHGHEVEAELRQPLTGAAKTFTPPNSLEQPTGPLTGLRVLEITAGMAGPWVGRWMAWAGAEVIRVESHTRPDVVRLYVSPRNPELGTQPERSPWFTDWNAGKRFLALDLTRPRAVELLRRLARRCDVVIENMAAGIADKLGVGYSALAETRPELVMLSTSGFGATGPHARHVTWGPNIEAISGLATLSGFSDRATTFTQFAHPDALSALHGLVAVLAALDFRDRDGRGQHIDLSQYECLASSLGEALVVPLNQHRAQDRIGNRDPGAAPHGIFRCAGEDRWCAIAVENDEQWRALCAAMNRSDWLAHPKLATTFDRLARETELELEIESWTLARQAEDVAATLQQAGVPAGVVQNVDDLLRRDPHLAERDAFERIPHRRGGAVIANGIPLRFGATPGRTAFTGGAVGHDNDYVLRGILELQSGEIEELMAEGAVERSREP